MTEADTAMEPDWDSPLEIPLTPAAIVHTLFSQAETVHTGWDSCVDHALTVAETTAVDERTGNHCRLVEQEYSEDDEPEVTWHDWTVELKVGEVYVTAHWRAQDSAPPADWDWCASQAESAFASGCVLVGKRVRRGLVIEESPRSERAPRTHH